MTSLTELAQEIKSIGFRCKRCGECCSKISEDSNLVMVGPPEVRRIMKSSGLKWDDIAGPYPDLLKAPNGCQYTFAWSINRTRDRCSFLEGNRCRIYSCRPWICRTYPFMLGDDGLMVFECPGVGEDMDLNEALKIAEELIERKKEEDMELNKVQEHFADADLPEKGLAVIDSEGVKLIHG